jgi:hypothetical protein
MVKFLKMSIISSEKNAIDKRFDTHIYRNIHNAFWSGNVSHPYNIYM